MDSHDPAPEMASWDAFRTATNDAVRERTGKSNFRMTDEQEFIVQEFQRGKNLRIKALAGCSKTTTCMLCALASQHRRPVSAPAVFSQQQSLVFPQQLGDAWKFRPAQTYQMPLKWELAT